MNIQELKLKKVEAYKHPGEFIIMAGGVGVGKSIVKEALSSVIAEVELIENRQNKKLTDLEIDSVIKKTISVFREQEKLWGEAGRPTAEFSNKAEFLETLLPRQMTEEEIDAAIVKGIVESKALNVAEMGKVMAYLKTEYGSSIDMKIASEKVREALLKE